MQEQWVIDGYNLIHGLATKSSKPSPRELASTLASFASFTKVHVLMVLDGTGDEAELLPQKTPYFNIVYSKEITADAFIERFIFENREKFHLVVVTRDSAILQIARGSGARTMNVEEFKKEMSEHSKDVEDKLFKNKIESHGFNRPFLDKLKKFKL